VATAGFLNFLCGVIGVTFFLMPSMLFVSNMGLLSWLLYYPHFHPLLPYIVCISMLQNYIMLVI
jgi:hypothetical protein